jgi:uncharacterized membrane protein YkoI
MFVNAKSVRESCLLGAVMLATAFIAEGAHATATPVDAATAAAVQAATITKQRAEAIALQAVGGGSVVLAVLEREDGLVHWSIDITGSTDEYEVWVSTHGKLLKIIAQPL